MSEQLIRSKIERDLQTGAMQFFDRHPELRISRCDANVNLLSSAIGDSSKYTDPTAWDAAFAEVGQALAPLEKKAPPVAPQPEPWRWPFPQFKTVGDVRRCPGDIYRQWYFDKTEKGEAFRNMVNSILDAENQRRSE